MKKVLRTILTMALLVIAFVFYMKWFNAPLAEMTANFIFTPEIQADNCLASGENLDENDVLVKLENLEEHMNTLENLIEIQNAKIIPDQFDVPTPVDTEPTEEELFEEFKTWRETNK
jgi:hypothetical protein